MWVVVIDAIICVFVLSCWWLLPCPGSDSDVASAWDVVGLLTDVCESSAVDVGSGTCGSRLFSCGLGVAASSSVVGVTCCD